MLQFSGHCSPEPLGCLCCPLERWCIWEICQPWCLLSKTFSVAELLLQCYCWRGPSIPIVAAQGFQYSGDLSCRVGFFGLADLQKEVSSLRDLPLYKYISQKAQLMGKHSNQYLKAALCKEIMEIAQGEDISSPSIPSLGHFWNSVSFPELSIWDWYSKPKISSECACLHSLCECENPLNHL